MRLVIALGLLLLAVQFSTGQKSRVDSLISQLEKVKEPKSKAKLLHSIVFSLWDYSFEQGYQYAKKEVEIAELIDDPEALTVAYTDLGMYYYFIGNYDEAGITYSIALDKSNGKDFGEYPAYTYTRIGNLYRIQGQYDSALKYYSLTERLLKSKPKGNSLASLYFHWGWLLTDISEFEKAFKFLYQARDIRYTLKDSLLIAESWRVIGEAHTGLGNVDSAQYYFNKVLGIADRFEDTELLILTSINLGDYYILRGESVEAIKSFQVALDSLVKHDFKRYRALALRQIGRVFDSRGDYLKALDYYFESLKLNDELNSTHEIAETHNFIGWVHTNLKNFELAEQEALLALNLMKKIKDKAGQAFSYNLLGYIDFGRGEYNKAIVHYDSALNLREELGLPLMASNTKFNIARVYERLGKLNEALRYYLEDLEATSRLNNNNFTALSYNNIGWLYARMGDYKKAEEYLKDGLALSRQFSTPTAVRDNYLYQARMWGFAGRAERSNDFYARYVSISDSIQIQQNSAAAQQRDAIYQLEKKNREILELNEREKLREQESQAIKKQILFQNVVIILSFAILLLLLVFIYVLYRYNRSKSRANDQLNKLNRSILEQKEEILAQSEELQGANETILEINKSLELKVRERTNQLNQAFTELDTFIYRSSHDLRRPLTTFMGLAEVARISVRDDTAIELFDRVSDTARNLDRMLAKLQSVSQIASTDLSARKVFMDVELDYVLDQYRHIIIDQKIKIIRDVRVSEPVNTYPSLLRIILENLIENALAFAQPIDAWIQIRITKDKQLLILEIDDNGEGIREEFRNRIFEMYFRANERSKGNGLGLFLVKRATEKLNGEVHFTAKQSGGTLFTATIHVE